MERKKKSVSGFTLAELLIVVAIIAVLVAIAIPIFTSQLEKSREAVDLSDVRSAYAEVMMAAITGDTTAIYTKDSTQTIYDSQKNEYSITVQPLKQKQDGWQTALPITIGGVSSSAESPYWIGEPGPNGYCKVTYHPVAGSTGEYVSFEWSGGNSGTSGGTSGGDGGTGGGSGDSGENSTPGTGGSVTPTPIPSMGDAWKSIVEKNGMVDWPTAPTNGWYSWKTGQIVRFEGIYYISLETNRQEFNQWGYFNPMSDNRKSNFAMVSGRFYTSNDVDTQGNVPESSYGDIFIDDDGTAYVYKAGYKGQARPNPNAYGDPWVKIIK